LGKSCDSGPVSSWPHLVRRKIPCAVHSPVSPPEQSVDLNALVEPGSNITVGDVNYINDIGEIAVTGTLPNGDHHAVLLVPHGDCDDDCEGRIAASQNDAAPTEYAGTMAQGSESRVSPANLSVRWQTSRPTSSFNRS
jgi:hypothetical protein